MENNISKVQEQGVCPYCKSADLEYGALEIDGDSLYYPTTCNKCAGESEENYELKYTGYSTNYADFSRRLSDNCEKIDLPDGVGYDGTASIESNRERLSAYIHEMICIKEGSLYPRKCSITGRGMVSGWNMDGTYITDAEVDGVTGEQRLEAYVKQEFQQTTQEFWEEVEEDSNSGYDYYWTEWEELDEDYAYLEDGSELTLVRYYEDYIEYADHENDKLYKVIA